jgi:hypothetical protein
MIRSSQLPIFALCLVAIGCGGSTKGDGSGTGGIGGAAGAAGGGAGAGGSPAGCEYDGHSYQPGESFANGCNTCTCTKTGLVCSDTPCVTGCSYGGSHYSPGESFPATDGCNKCSCQSDGSVICTEMDCAPTCVYGGISYAPGDSFPSLDGCNKCTCGADGSVGCTKMACPCDAAAEWWRDYVGGSPEVCSTIKFTCPENTTAFFNGCGCGCEQSPECPKYFDCMPPASCNPAELEKKCPYSGIVY